MRIIAGALRGRRIDAPRGRDTRPTTDRVRESLFQHLEVARLDGGFVDRHVLDLFAGSGALGLEALSRGAASVTFVDHGRAALQCLQQNVTTLGVAAQATVVRGRLPAWLARVSAPARGWDLVFADPPYARDGIDDVLVALRPHVTDDAWVVYEHAVNTAPTKVADGWAIVGDRSMGGTAYTFVRPESDSG